MMSAKPRVGVVGTGRFGQNHSRIYSELSNCDFIGIFDLNEERGGEISQRDNVPLYKSYSALLDDVDFISVVTPTSTHFEVASEAIKRGKNTLVEKPIATTGNEAQELIDLARENDVDLRVGHLERFNAALLSSLNLCSNLKFIKALRLGLWVGRKVTVDVVSDLMIHDLDILNMLDSSELTSIKATGKAVVSPYTDYADVWLEYSSGLKASLEANRISSRRFREIEFYSDDKIINVDMMNQKVKESHLVGGTEEGYSDIVYNDIDVERTEPLKAELQAFLNRDGQTIAHGIDGLKALELALQILEVLDAC